MFDIGGAELLFLVVLALVVFGPRRLPQMGRQLGEYAAKLRRSWRELQSSIEREVSLEDLKQAQKEVRALRAEARKLKRDVLSGVDPIPRRSAPGAAGGPGCDDADRPVGGE